MIANAVKTLFTSPRIRGFTNQVKANYIMPLLAFAIALIVSLLNFGCSGTTTNRVAVEKAHGLKLPKTAYNFQQLRDPGLIDHGVFSIFEMNSNEVNDLTKQLKIRERLDPVQTNSSDPREIGLRIWPQNAGTFVPGINGIENIKVTWPNPAQPVEMLSCSSPRGDWLHVEIWSVGDHVLVKLYTDWN